MFPFANFIRFGSRRRPEVARLGRPNNQVRYRGFLFTVSDGSLTMIDLKTSEGLSIPVDYGDSVYRIMSDNDELDKMIRAFRLRQRDKRIRKEVE